jgi:hypothetical protein
MGSEEGWLASGMKPPATPYSPTPERAAELHGRAMARLELAGNDDDQAGLALAHAAQFEATMLVYREMRALRKALKKIPAVG